jgi:hypothetical protein
MIVSFFSPAGGMVSVYSSGMEYMGNRRISQLDLTEIGFDWKEGRRSLSIGTQGGIACDGRCLMV